MIDPFAAAQKTEQSTNGKNKTDKPVIDVDDTQVGQAIDQFISACSKLKVAEAEKKAAESIVRPSLRRKFLEIFAAATIRPRALKFRNPASGATVTLVAQDRGSKLNDEQIAHLKSILGDRVEEVVEHQRRFIFNNEVLSKPGVRDAVAEAIGELVKKGRLSAEDASNLLTVEETTVLRKGTLDKLAKLCESDPDRMEAVMDSVGSGLTTYVKP